MLKWYVPLSAALLLLLFAFGGNPPPIEGSGGLIVFKDPQTGCEYLARGAIVPFIPQMLTPRMGADGRQVCRAP